MDSESKKTVIIGASPNPSRYANMAAGMLEDYGHEIVPISIKRGEVNGHGILDIREQPEVHDVDTITMYVGPRNQPPIYDYLLSLRPKRMIFNPGTENYDFMQRASNEGIEVVEGCTLVMLRAGQY